MNGGSAAKIRLVRCPKCRNVLVEPKDIPVYTCGGCSTYLRAKIRKSNPEVATSGLHETDADQKNTSAGAGSTNKEVTNAISASAQQQRNEMMMAHQREDLSLEDCRITAEEMEIGSFHERPSFNEADDPRGDPSQPSNDQLYSPSVLPIFYDTAPSDVRKQTGSYAKAFDKHEEHFKEEMEKVNRRREALAQAANLPGWGLNNETKGSNQHMHNEKPNVFINGKPIPDRLVKRAEKLAGPIQPGDYWYDVRAGFWGVTGKPCAGIIPADEPRGDPSQKTNDQLCSPLVNNDVIMNDSQNLVGVRTEPVVQVLEQSNAQLDNLSVDAGRIKVEEDEDVVNNSGRLEQPDAGGSSSGGPEELPHDELNVIWSLLMDDEVSTIGIYGMGGAGKTTMLKHIYEEEGQRREQVISATEPISNISPNGRFRRVFTYWEKGELLGRGSFASVYEGISDDGDFFAVKEVSLLDQGTQGKQSIYQLEQEIALLSRFEHENIVQYYGTDKDESKLYIFLELVTKGSLQKLYQTYKLRDSQVSSYTRQILHGLKYLHDQKVVHRDIKCANLLVDANGSVKLADFGLAKATKLNDVNSCKGTAFWMAPEVVNNKNQGYGLSADIWSLGCTVLEMLTRQIPYSELEFMQALFRIGRGVPPHVPDSLSNDARDFILQCLQVNPNDRPTAAVLLDHPFVKKNLSTSLGSASIIEV